MQPFSVCLSLQGMAACLVALVSAGCAGPSVAPTDAGTDAGTDTNSMCTPVGAREDACVDGRDDDCDGHIDCADVDCAGSSGCVAVCVPTPEDAHTACSNGRDDDCDGLVDCADPECIQPGVFTCLGAPWPSRCVGALPGSQTMLTSDIQLLLTSSGVSGVAAHSASGVSVDILTRGATAAPTPVDLVSPPNDNRDTCSHCFVLHRGGKDYFVRNASVVLGALPTAVGEPFSATLRGTFEEVATANNRVTPVTAGECLLVNWTLTGTAVSSSSSLGLSGTGVAQTAGLTMRQGQGSGPYLCDGLESIWDDVPDDCTCGQSTMIACPGGHACPYGSTCLTQGRCACGEHETALDCESGGVCGTGTTTCAPGSAWSCVQLGCGEQNYTVDCGDGYSCPTRSTCTADSCVCDPGYEMQACGDIDIQSPTPNLGQCVRVRIPACAGGVPYFACPFNGGLSCPEYSTCGNPMCGCDLGYVAATCDGIRCSAENPCIQGFVSGCFPDAQVP